MESKLDSIFLLRGLARLSARSFPAVIGVCFDRQLGAVEMQLVDLDDAEQELPGIDFEMKGLDLQHGRKRPIGVGGPHIIRLEAKNRNDLQMKFGTEMDVQTSRVGETALENSNGLRSAEPLDQDLACGHQDDDRSSDHQDSPLSIRLHFIGSIWRNFGA